MSEADAIIFMVDVKDGIMPADAEIADLVRRLKKPTLLVANKGDNDKLEAQAVEFYKLGLGEPFVISAYHGRSTAELIEKIIAMLPESTPVTGRAGNHESGHRRQAQRGQIDAAERHSGQRKDHRFQCAGDNPRRHRYRSGFYGQAGIC